MKMIPPEMEILRFDAEDVIATSGEVGGHYHIDSGISSTYSIAYGVHDCSNVAMHLYYKANPVDGKEYTGILFTEDGAYVGDNYNALVPLPLQSDRYETDNYYHIDVDAFVAFRCPGSN